MVEYRPFRYFNTVTNTERQGASRRSVSFEFAAPIASLDDEVILQIAKQPETGNAVVQT